MPGTSDKPSVPADLATPGLIYRLRRRGWVLSWSPQSDLTNRGLQMRTVRLWPSESVPPQQIEPTCAEWETIAAWCQRAQAEQAQWARVGVRADPLSAFDGTIGALLKLYQRYPKSPFKRLRHDTMRVYANNLTAINTLLGKVRVLHVTFDDITTWQQIFADPGDGSKPMKARSGTLIARLRQVFIFGALILPKHAGCHDVVAIFDLMRQGKLLKRGHRSRTQYMTAAQCRLIRHKAHEMGWPSIALQQAFAFELGLRQKDVIGEWIPIGDPGTTDVHWGNRKWVVGIRWEEIDKNLILTHRLSKSIHGKDAVNDADDGKLKAWCLSDFPMIMDELRHVAGKERFTRADLPTSGALVICESIGRPWLTSFFRRKWRQIATAAGVPEAIQSRDSRPGAATEAKLAGAATADVQRQLGHASAATTEGYLREQIEEHRKLARLRTEKRK